ncbi:uncharacterized protein CTRU02_208622 [Colletotrichum truncatum]|uniref:Uncharacterized protein n=1 Tax=Colletotrichum truncatum TaxID=5467 RepID=A0ACC3YZK4_COLTU|nr:uncharacterized protein CTRU02_15020 [Colletotrichum truncatum]KAF6781515.1 hypothetical protein CTRU02_15020 [Colletotrichum truncatum]
MIRIVVAAEGISGWADLTPRPIPTAMAAAMIIWTAEPGSMTGCHQGFFSCTDSPDVTEA